MDEREDGTMVNGRRNFSGSLRLFYHYNKGQEIRWNNENRVILVTGKMRLAGKNHSTFDFLLRRNGRILYITRAIGRNEQGTFYDSKETIRKLENEPNRSKKIAMIAGLSKICSIRQQDEVEDDDEIASIIDELNACIGCNRNKIKELPSELIAELQSITTLAPGATKELADKYELCPKRILKYYVENFADIVFMTYKMIITRPELVDDFNADYIVYDEARHLMDAGIKFQCTIANINKDGKEKPTCKEWAEAIENQLIPKRYDIKEIKNGKAPPWYPDYLKALHYLSRFLPLKLHAYFNAKEISENHRGSYDALREFFIEEDAKLWGEYVSTGNAIYAPNFVDEYFEQVDDRWIRGRLNKLVKWRKRCPDDKELHKAIRLIYYQYKLAGSRRIDFEFLMKFNPIKKKYQHTLTMRGYQEIPQFRGRRLTFFLDGTPYSEELYDDWLGTTKEDLNIVHLPSKKEVSIIYVTSKKLTADTYSRRSDRELHIRLLKGLTDRLKHLGVLVGARTKDVESMLHKQGIDVDLVVNDARSEGTQLKGNVLILEGTQIESIGAGESCKYELARSLGLYSPSYAFTNYKSQRVVQTNIQSAFRAVSRKDSLNCIVMLGAKFSQPIEWKGREYENLPELAVELYGWDKVRLIPINGNIKTESKIEQIATVVDLIQRNKYIHDCSVFENLVFNVISKYCINHDFIEGVILREILRYSPNDVMMAVNNLIDNGYLEMIVVPTRSKPKYAYRPKIVD